MQQEEKRERKRGREEERKRERERKREKERKRERACIIKNKLQNLASSNSAQVVI